MCCFMTPASNPAQRWFVIAAAWVWLVHARSLLGAEGYLVTVTATPGKIMERDKVLAEVPAGTRLWVFKVSADKQWVEVKVPNGEQHGWLLEKSTAAIKLTDRQQEQLKQAYQLFTEYKGLAKENKTKEAIASLEKSLQHLRAVKGNDDPEVAQALVHLGNLAATQGDLRLSRQCFDEALAVFHKYWGKAGPDVGYGLSNLGEQAAQQDRYAEARQAYSEALTIYRKNDAKDVNNIGGTLLKLGTCHAIPGMIGREKILRRSAPHLSAANGGTRRCRMFVRLGLLAAAAADYPRRKKSYAEALAICRKSNDKLGSAELLLYLGGLQHSEGDDANAQQSFEEALRLYRTEQDHDKTIATHRYTRRHRHVQLPRFSVAKKYIEEAIALSEQHFGRDDARLAEGHRLLGALFRFQGNFPLAQEHLERALKIAREHELNTIVPNV